MSRDNFLIDRRNGSPRSVRLPAPGAGRRDRRRLRPVLLELEDRRLLSLLSIVVNNPTDIPVAGETDLRQAVEQADGNAGNSFISFDPTVFSAPKTINLEGSALELSNRGALASILGPPAGVTISGGGQSRVFEVDGGVQASISGLTIFNGSAGAAGGGLDNEGTAFVSQCTFDLNSAGGHGGSLYNASSAMLDLTNCTLFRNSAAYGGGLDNEGTANLTDCTITVNQAGGHGAGLDNGLSGTLNMAACTISGNSAAIAGGGLDNFHTANLVDTIVAGNIDSTSQDDIANTVAGSFNLIGSGGAGGLADGTDNNIVLSGTQTAGLAPLGSYDGPT